MQKEIKPRIRKIEFDLTVFARLMTQGSEFRIKQGLPQNAILLGTELKGNAVVMHVQSVEFEETTEIDPELEIQVDEFKKGTGWS